MKTKTTSTLIKSYLSRRSTPATFADIIRGVTNKTSGVKPETIRRTVYRMVDSDQLEQKTVQTKGSTRPGFLLV